MLNFIRNIGVTFLKFLVELVNKATLILTLISVLVCLVLFYVFMFTGYPLYSFLSLAGMICAVYVNKSF